MEFVREFNYKTYFYTKGKMCPREYTKWALQEVFGWKEFEDICAEFLYCKVSYKNIRQAGRTGDKGRDAVVLYDKKEEIIFAFSMEKDPIVRNNSKFYSEYSKWKNQPIHKFVFVSNQDLGAKKIDLAKQLSNPPVEMFDITDLVRFLDITPEGEKVKARHGLAKEKLPFIIRTDEGQEEELGVSAKYTILAFEDVSHGLAKRYSADLLVNEPITKTYVKEIVKIVTNSLQVSEFHRNERIKAQWAGVPAHVIWLFVYVSLDDVMNANWICRSQWISENLALEFAPLKLIGDDKIDQIVVDWNNDYLQRAKLYQAFTIKKEVYVDKINSFINHIKELIDKAIKLTEEQVTDTLSVDDYILQMKLIEPVVTELSRDSGDIGQPPFECKDLDETFRSVMAFAYNIVLPFSDRGLTTWSEKSRKFLVSQAIKDYLQEYDKLKFEQKKLLG